MAYAEVQLSGSLDFRLAIAVDYAGQDWASNYTNYLIGVGLQNPGNNPTWSGSAQYWSANIGGYTFGGSFIMDFRGGKTGIQLLSTYVSIYHDANGYGTDPWYSVASIDTNHASVGDGSVGVYFSGVPRIPKAPGAPTPYPSAALALDQITPTSMRYRFQDGPNNGAGITSRAVQYSTSPDFSTGNSPWIGVDTSGTLVATGLISGVDYYWRARIQNAVGVSPNSQVVSARTLSAVKRSIGGAYANCDVLISKGGLWVPAQTSISKSGAWVAAG